MSFLVDQSTVSKCNRINAWNKSAILGWSFKSQDNLLLITATSQSITQIVTRSICMLPANATVIVSSAFKDEHHFCMLSQELKTKCKKNINMLITLLLLLFCLFGGIYARTWWIQINYSRYRLFLFRPIRFYTFSSNFVHSTKNFRSKQNHETKDNG